jgi:acyl-CoA reductase-like NAD-dependent aldehyde dehydrogenase
MSAFTMTLDGKALKGEATFPVINPATGAPFAEAPECTRAQLDEAMAAAQAAQKAWRRDEARRRQVLGACADAIQGRLGELAPLLTREQGKPLARANEEILAAVVQVVNFAKE